MVGNSPIVAEHSTVTGTLPRGSCTRHTQAWQWQAILSLSTPQPKANGLSVPVLPSAPEEAWFPVGNRV